MNENMLKVMNEVHKLGLTLLDWERRTMKKEKENVE